MKKIQVKEGTILRGEIAQEFPVNIGTLTTVNVPVTNIPKIEHEARLKLVVTFTYLRNGAPLEVTRNLEVGESVWYLNP